MLRAAPFWNAIPGPQESAQVPEGIATGPVHLADATIRQVDRTRQAAHITGNVQGIEAGHDITLRIGIVVKAHQPVRLGNTFGDVAKTQVEPPRATTIGISMDNYQRLLFQASQPFPGAVR